MWSGAIHKTWEKMKESVITAHYLIDIWILLSKYWFNENWCYTILEAERKNGIRLLNTHFI